MMVQAFLVPLVFLICSFLAFLTGYFFGYEKALNDVRRQVQKILRGEQ